MLIEADFQSEYGIDLGECRGKSWRWFQVRVQGLMAADTRLARHFQPQDDGGVTNG